MSEKNPSANKKPEIDQIKERVEHFARQARLNKQMREQKARGERPLWPEDPEKTEMFPALGHTGLRHPNSFEKPIVDQDPDESNSDRPSLREVSDSLAKSEGERFYSAPSYADRTTEMFKIPKIARLPRIARPYEAPVDVYTTERDAQLEALSKDSPTEPIPVISGAELYTGNVFAGAIEKMKEIAQDHPDPEVNRTSVDHQHVRRVRDSLRQVRGMLPTDKDVESVYVLIDELESSVHTDDMSVYTRKLSSAIDELEKLSENES